MNKIKKPEYDSFNWDEGNINKNEIKHGVFFKECEEVFLDKPIFEQDIKHSQNEKRFHCIGLTYKKRGLFITFTIRKNKIRIISARTTDSRERKDYEKA